jgi:hypothetical protein
VRWFASAFIVLSLAAVAQQSPPPSPTPAKAGQENQNQAAPKSSKTESDKHASADHASATAQPVPVVTTGNQPEPRKPPEKHPATDWGFIWSVINTGLLTFFSGALAWLAHRQHQAMKMQAIYMRGALKETKKAADAASGQVKLMGEQLAEMKTTSTDTHDLAVAAKDAAAAAKQQTIWAEHGMDAMIRQERVMISQGNTMLTQASAAVISAEAARDGVAATLRQLEAYERPWVTASFEVWSPIEFTPDGGLSVMFKIWRKNIGRSIATHITIDAEIVPEMSLRVDHAPVIAAQDRIAQRLKPQASEPALFAGDDVSSFVRLNSDSIEKHAVNWYGEKYLALCLAVVIKYRYPTSDRDHTTRLAFVFGNNNDEPFKDALFVKFGETLPREKIAILKLPVGNGAD